MKVTKIIIRTETGKKITINPNDSHDVSLIEVPIINYMGVIGFEYPVSINSITAVVVHPKNISTDSVMTAIKKLSLK